jgi:P4 family phage/plasmid primase-like protien
MINDFTKYKENKLVVISVNISQKQHKNGSWKKELCYPKDWENFTLDKSYYNQKWNGLSLLTGKINNIIVVDIDNIEHWNQFLNKYNEKEPNTVKVISGSGGIHLYFKYCDEFKKIKSSAKCFDANYDIDIRTNGGNIILPPTSYFNKNLNKEVSYIWERNIFDNELMDFPIWMKNILMNNDNKNNKLSEKIKVKNLEKKQEEEKQKKIINEKLEKKYDMEKNIMVKTNNLDTDNDAKINFTIGEIENLVNMLSYYRCDNYNDWINVGMCLHNIDIKFLLIWMKWSKQSEKYQDGDCEQKWNSFKKEKNGLKIGSLILWAKNDSPIKYDSFIRKKKTNQIIKQKYPHDNLIIGESLIINDNHSYIHLKNKECFFEKKEHPDMPHSMYIEIIDKFMAMKCRNGECFGKMYPCQHMHIDKQEMNVIFNGNINIMINNDHNEELTEFQEIDIYEDPKLNELVFNSLNGESSQLAEIIYYYYKDSYVYGNDYNWYLFENHKWKNGGIKNLDLRNKLQPKLKDLYKQLFNYYKNKDIDKNKLKLLKNIEKTFGETILKNNIMTELTELYSVNNKNPDFISKLDLNNYLIGFDNGVYDLTKFEFRDGKHNDYISMTVGYDYCDQHTEKYNDLLNFLEDIQPNKEERDYMLTYLSIGLVGNLLELFTILTGNGRNGKSKLIELLAITFGEYMASVASQMFTRPRPDANSPDPGLLNLMKKRIVIASEPEKNAKLNSGFIKFITGRDSTTLRTCHSNDMIKFTAKFVTLLICNDIPDCDDIDNAFSKRLRCVNFPTEFVAEPKKDNQKKLDTNINLNFELWKMDFMLLLIEHYKKYTEHQQLKTTNNILAWTNQYQENTDLYLQFLNECTEENKKGHIHCSILYDSFKIWFKNNNSNTKIPSNREFITNLRKYKKVTKVLVNKKSQVGIKFLRIV